MTDGDKNEREGLLTTIRARRKWYLSLYFLQISGWLVLVVVNEVYYSNSTDIISQRVLNSAVTMSFIGQGTLVTTILLIDVIFDGCRYLIEKGGELMGLLFSPVKNRFFTEGEKKGQKQANARWSAWITDNPEIKKMIDEGKVENPPKSDDDR